MYAKRLLEHFRCLCDRPTICGAKTSHHWVTVFWGHIGDIYFNKSKLYPCNKKLGLVTNIGSKYFRTVNDMYCLILVGRSASLSQSVDM